MEKANKVGERLERGKGGIKFEKMEREINGMSYFLPLHPWD